MTEIDKILSDKSHRAFDFPNRKWLYYQEWNRAVFLHWKVSVEILRKLVPQKLEIDTFDGSAYVSLVAFTMEKIRPRYLPSVKFISCFDEINLRTYIDNDHKKGVYFLNIEAGKHLSSLIAKGLSGLPYEKSNINRLANRYTSRNDLKNFCLNISYKANECITQKTELDHWLTERYCLYLDKGKQLYRYHIHHREWALKRVSIDSRDFRYELGDLKLTAKPDITHYSDGVKVVAWKREKI